MGLENLKPPRSLTKLFHQFTDFNSDEKQNLDHIRNCKCCNINKNQTPNKFITHTLSLFHINACSLSRTMAGLEYLLDSTQTNLCYSYNSYQNQGGQPDLKNYFQYFPIYFPVFFQIF